MPMSLVTLPGPSGTPVLLTWGTAVTNNSNEFVDILTEPTSAWTAYTPAWTSTGTAPAIGNGAITGKFMQFGKVGFFTGDLLSGTTTTYGTGIYRFSLPVGWSMAGSGSAVPVDLGGALIIDASTSTNFIGQLRAVTATTFAIATHAAITNISGTVPMTFATGDIIQWRGVVELA